LVRDEQGVGELLQQHPLWQLVQEDLRSLHELLVACFCGSAEGNKKCKKVYDEPSPHLGSEGKKPKELRAGNPHVSRWDFGSQS
jgi:hypothetical protein